VKRLGLEPGTFWLQTVGSTAAPGPPFVQKITGFKKNVGREMKELEHKLTGALIHKRKQNEMKGYLAPKT